MSGSGAKPQKSSMRDPTEPEGMTFITDRAEIFKLLVHSSSTECEAVLSFRGDSRRFGGQLRELARYSDRIQVDLGTSEQAAQFVSSQQAALGAGRSECLVLIHSKRQYVIGLHCRISTIEGVVVTFEFPDRVFKLQRRKALRWVLTGAYQVEFEMDFPDASAPEGKRTLKHRLTDVSPGGVSFYLPTIEETEPFVVGLDLSNLSFVLQGQRYSAHGVVRGVLPLPRNFHLRGYRVGIEFTQIEEAQVDRLERYVITQSAYSMI